MNSAPIRTAYLSSLATLPLISSKQRLGSWETVGSFFASSILDLTAFIRSMYSATDPTLSESQCDDCADSSEGFVFPPATGR